jgi:N-methylhydantoinase A
MFNRHEPSLTGSLDPNDTTARSYDMLCLMRIGVEVGGTFTDLVAIQDGKVRTAKVPSTPRQPELGAFAALQAWGGDIGSIEELAHGSTVATNAVLERKGARVCMVVSAGTRDVLRLQRHNRRRIYDLHYAKPKPLVSHGDTFEVDERMAPDGAVIRPLVEGDVSAVLNAALKGGEYEALAIAFLNSYANPSHEHQVAQIARELGWTAPITCSADISAVFREYERFSTTAMAAYVQPVIARYLTQFEKNLTNAGFDGHFSVMQSNGGRLPAAAMGDNAITALFSGPAAGVVGATHSCLRSGYSDLITFDMGGTSTDVCLVERGQPQLVGETEVDGLPVKTPVLDIVTVGAGGGSIVWVDDGGLLRVGPQSAGADPGPAAYGHGGTQPTVTDAHVIRGTIRADSFLGGAMALDEAAAHAAMEPIANHLSVSVREAADAAIRVAESNIVRAIQRISTERGKDPRGYALVPFGGAGPMQAVRVAEELGLPTVVVPPHAGVLSAMGLLASDYVHFESRTRRLPVDADHMVELVELTNDLRGRVGEFFAAAGFGSDVHYTFTYDMRYVTQAFEIPVQVDAAEVREPNAQRLAEQFDAAHEQIFEFASGHTQASEIVSVRVGGAVTPGALPSIELALKPGGGGTPMEIFEAGRPWQATCLARTSIVDEVQGPLIIEDETSTIYLPADWVARHDDAYNLVIQRAGS